MYLGYVCVRIGCRTFNLLCLYIFHTYFEKMITPLGDWIFGMSKGQMQGVPRGPRPPEIFFENRVQNCAF